MKEVFLKKAFTSLAYGFYCGTHEAKDFGERAAALSARYADGSLDENAIKRITERNNALTQEDKRLIETHFPEPSPEDGTKD